MSEKIINATFDTKGDLTGWTLKHNNGSNHAEVKNGVVTGRAYFDLQQTISGLKPGIYKVTAQAFTRPDENAKVWASIQNGETPVNKTVLYANSKETACPLITSEGYATSQSGWTNLEGLGYVPNSSGQAAKAFELGMYKVEVKAIVGEDGILTFGVRNDFDDWNNYAGADNFKLYYLGEADNVSQADIDQLMASVPAGKMEASVEAELDKAFEALKAEPTANNYAAAVAAIQAAQKSVEAYARIQAALDDAENETLSEQARDLFDNAVKDIRDGYANGSITGDGTAETEQIKKALTEAKSSDIGTETDCTSFIENPQFDQGTTGWDGDFGKGAKKGLSSNYVITCFGSGFDIHQTVKGLKPGTYRLQAQAFSRPSSNDETWNAVQKGDDVVNETYLYANGKEKAVKLIAEDWLNEKPGEGTWSSYTLNGKTCYVPNNSTAMSVAFSAGMYENEMTCIVGQDGVLTLGIKNLDASNSNAYAGYDNFRLTYLSADTIDRELEDLTTREDSIARTAVYASIATQALDASAFDNVYNRARNVLETAGSTDEEVKTAYAEIEQAFHSLLQNGTTATGQFDLTDLLDNTDFAANMKGWNHNGAFRWKSIGVCAADNATGGDRLNKTLANMPAGHYELKAQGFYLPQGWKQALYDREHGKETLKLQLYAANGQTEVKSIFDDASYMLASACISRTEDVGATIDGRGYPLLIDARVNDALTAGAYWNIVSTDLSESGPLEMGVKVDENPLDGNRSIVDNFRLYYGQRKPVTMTAGKNYSIKEDVACDVIIKKTLQAGILNPLAVPCDIPGDRFKAVYEIGAIDPGNKTVTVYPVQNVHAGVPCYVEVNSNLDSIIVGPTTLRAATPDRIPLPWDGGAVQAVYSSMSWRANPVTGVMRQASYFTNIEIQKLQDMHLKANIENMQVARFLTTDYSSESSSSEVFKYNVPAPARRDQPHAIGLPVPENKAGDAVLKYWNKDNAEQVATSTVACTKGMCYVANLIPGNTYEYEISSAQGETLTQGEIEVKGMLRFVYAPSVYNLRDLGGWTTSTGQAIRYGLIYRGGEVNGVHPAIGADLETLKRLGIGAEVDLRYNDTYDQDRETGKSGYGFTTGDTYYFAASNWYTADHITNSDCQKQMAEEFRFILKNIRKGLGVHFHCAFGADRTGFLAVLLEGLLGMDVDQLCHEYELTSFAAPAGNRNKSTILSIINAVRNNSKGASLRDRFEDYWTSKCGITADEIKEFRQIMLTGNGDPNRIENIAAGTSPSEVDKVFTLSGIQVDKDKWTSKPDIYIVQFTDGTVRKINTPLKFKQLLLRIQISD